MVSSPSTKPFGVIAKGFLRLRGRDAHNEVVFQIKMQFRGRTTILLQRLALVL